MDQNLANILIVDDHADSAIVLSKMLSRARPEYSIATSGSCSEALEAVKTRRFDLLLCDIGLPDGDGCELLRQVLCVYSIPAIAISGYVMRSDLSRYLEAGFNDCVEKPFRLDVILNSIDRVMGNGALPNKLP